MTESKVLEYLQSESVSEIELKDVNGQIYIKFDWQPFTVREFVLNHKLYDANKMINLTRDCNCGNAYFYPKDLYMTIMKDFKI